MKIIRQFLVLILVLASMAAAETSSTTGSDKTTSSVEVQTTTPADTQTTTPDDTQTTTPDVAQTTTPDDTQTTTSDDNQTTTPGSDKTTSSVEVQTTTPVDTQTTTPDDIQTATPDVAQTSTTDEGQTTGGTSGPTDPPGTAKPECGPNAHKLVGDCKCDDGFYAYDDKTDIETDGCICPYMCTDSPFSQCRDGAECVELCGTTMCNCIEENEYYFDGCLGACDYAGNDVCEAEGKTCDTPITGDEPFTCEALDEDSCETSEQLNDDGTACICKFGYRREKINDECTTYDVCMKPGHCSQHCDSTAINENKRCTCGDGYELDKDDKTKCVLMDGYETCDGVTGQACSKETGTDKECACTIIDGYEQVDEDITNIDECADETLNDCTNQYQTCVDTEGSYECQCQEGSVDDADEDNYYCLLEACDASCESGQTCFIDTLTNTAVCQDGPQNFNDEENAFLYYVVMDVTEGVSDAVFLNTMNYIMDGQFIIIKDSTRATSSLNAMYKSSIELLDPETTITDSIKNNCVQVTEDECVLPGGFSTTVKSAAEATCATITDSCNSETDCEDKLNGHYICSCKEGFETINDDDSVHQCVDIDECSDDPNPCEGTNSICYNMPGSKQCSCKDGFSGETCGTNLQSEIDDANQTSAILGGVLGSLLGVSLIAIGFLVYKMKKGGGIGGGKAYDNSAFD